MSNTQQPKEKIKLLDKVQMNWTAIIITAIIALASVIVISFVWGTFADYENLLNKTGAADATTFFNTILISLGSFILTIGGIITTVQIRNGSKLNKIEKQTNGRTHKRDMIMDVLLIKEAMEKGQASPDDVIKAVANAELAPDEKVNPPEDDFTDDEKTHFKEAIKHLEALAFKRQKRITDNNDKKEQ